MTLPQRAAGAPQSTCELALEGIRTGSGLKVARVVCAGDGITAAAHPSLLNSPQAVFKGVTWSAEGDCANLKSRCLLSICVSSSLVFNKPTIMHVNASALQAVVCVGGSSSVVIMAGQFNANNGTPLAVVGKGAKIVVKQSVFSNNVLHADDNEKVPGQAAAMFMEGGSGLVESCNFTGNSAVKGAGAIGLIGTASLHVRHSALKNNTGATVCSHVSSQHCCRVSIKGANMPSDAHTPCAHGAVGLYGGAVLTKGSAHVRLESSMLDGNTAKFGGCINLYDHSSGALHVKWLAARHKETAVRVSHSQNLRGTMGLQVDMRQLYYS